MTAQTGYRVHAWGEDPVWKEFERSAPGVGEVEVAVEACGVGLTVLNCINGNLADERVTLPVVPGHELVGRVVRGGPEVDASMVGRRVVAYFYRYCGACTACERGQESRCANLDGWIGVHSDGGYAPFAVLPARNAVAIDDELDPVHATVVPDAVATPVHVVATRAKVTAEDRVVVIGAGGGVGAHMIQVAGLYSQHVVGLDVGGQKLAMIEDLGATAMDSSDFGSVDPAQWADGHPTVVIDLLGSEQSLSWALDALGMGGRLVVLTTFPDQSTELDPRQLVFREAAVLGSRYASVTEVRTAAALVGTGKVRPVVGEVVEPKSVLDLHKALRHGELIGRGALVW